MTAIPNAQHIPIEIRRALIDLDRRVYALEEASLTDKITRTENEMLGDYGRTFSVDLKRKQLDKFGKNPDLDTADGFVIVSQLGTNPTIPTSNIINTIVSTDVGDTQDVIVEGHYLDGSGNLVFKVQTVTLTGTTDATLSQALARATRMYVPDGGPVTGTVTLDASSTATNYLQIAAGESQTQHCATSVSYRDAWFILNYGGAVLGTATAQVTFRLEHRPLFDTSGTAYSSPTWRPLTKDFVLAQNGSEQFPQETPIKVGPNTDVRLVASSSANNIVVTGYIDGYLAVDKALVNATDPSPA